MGAPVLFPLKIPDKNSGMSSSLRGVVPFGTPPLRRSISVTKSSTDNAIPGGQPSTTMPTAGPCDSPKILTLKMVQNTYSENGSKTIQDDKFYF